MRKLYLKIEKLLITEYEKILFLFFLIIGTALRLSYISKPFWYDEVWRVGAISEKDFLSFILQQKEAPISLGLALVTRVMIVILGNTEVSVRLFVVLLGVLIPPFAYIIVKKFSKNSVLALFSMLIFTISPDYIIHSTELKPFVLEVFAVFLLFLTFDKLWEESNLGNFFRLALVIILGLSFATPVVFFFPAVFALLFWKFLRGKDMGNLVKTSALCVITLVLSFLYYRNYLTPQTGTGLFDYWQENFSKGTGFLIYLKFLIFSFQEIFLQNIIPIADFMKELIFVKWLFAGVMFSFFLSGLCFFLRIKKIHLLFFISGGALTIIAFNIFRIWPFGSVRINLFLFSLLTIFTILGFYNIVVFYRSRNLRIIISLLFFIVVILLLPYREIYMIVKNYDNEYLRIGAGMRDAVEFVKKDLQPNDNIAVYYFLAPASFNYYYYHYDYGDSSIRGAIPEVEHFNDNKDFAPHRDEKFFKDNLKKGDRLWILAMDGLEDEDLKNILRNAENYGNYVGSKFRKFGDLNVYLYTGD